MGFIELSLWINIGNEIVTANANTRNRTLPSLIQETDSRM